LNLTGVTFVSYDVEPFLSTIFTHGSVSASAYPPTRSRGLLPLNLYYAWVEPALDQKVHDAVAQSTAQLVRVADSDGQDIADAPLYGNYAVDGTPVERIFGNSLPRMQATKSKYDPNNVMGLAGGWKV
jgi:hypothetical protein